MNSVQYLIKYKNGSKPVNKITDESKPKRKKRNDSGGKRQKYDSSLPIKYRQYLASANKRSIPFSLSVDDFNLIISKSCVYCGSYNKIGVDRFDSSIGYVLDNVQPCCGVCNLMKYSYDEEFFLNHIVRIIKHRRLNSFEL